MAKGLKLKVRNFWMLIPTFAGVTEEKLVGGKEAGGIRFDLLVPIEKQESMCSRDI